MSYKSIKHLRFETSQKPLWEGLGGLLFLLCFVLPCSAQSHLWTPESESTDTRISFNGDEVEMWAPKGLTLWYNKPVSGDCTIEYDACAVYEEGNDSEWNRVSDLNCFWKASDPEHPSDILYNKEWRSGIFLNCYSLQLYYLGYGGNYNSTTRFRRYDGNKSAVDEASLRPKILTEYTDSKHLIKPNHWYHIRIECKGSNTRYSIDGECIVDFTDDNPLKEGWFGFRTTKSHTKLRRFRVIQPQPPTSTPYNLTTSQPHSAPVPVASAAGSSLSISGKLIPLHWIGDEAPTIATPQTFGVPFAKGEMKPKQLQNAKLSNGTNVAVSPLAYWADGSVKWASVSAVVSPKTPETPETFETPETPETSETLNSLSLIATLSDGTTLPYTIDSTVVETSNSVRTCTKICGHVGKFPSILRVYTYAGSKQTKLVHTFIYDGDQDKDFIQSLGIQVKVPLKDELYNRHVSFLADGKLWSEPVQPLVGRRLLNGATLSDEDKGEAVQRKQMRGERIPPAESFDQKSQQLLKDWASWNRFRLSQLNDMSYTIRKQAKPDCMMVGTFAGKRADGMAFVGDKTNGLIAVMKDFWQSYPSTIEVTDACSESAKLTLWIWSPEAEAMDLRHYDKEGHGLNASYEDIQEGMSTPQGIARTTEIILVPTNGYCGPDSLLAISRQLTSFPQLACTPEYLYEKKAFGEWSLPKYDTPLQCQIENRLDSLLTLYKKNQEDCHWYGFWNYGDFMHTSDPVRNDWLYDVGGFAWDNTELATNMWLWYSFLRTGHKDVWKMAEAMFRHNSEVDVYHCGPHAGLGTRHNVSHWGCGAKEARISQAWWNRFYYYLTGDERAGELMEEVLDADQLLYTLDPMRLAQPREQFPCTAPARLRIGPDWLAYAGNWFAHWERTKDKKYLNKLKAGMKSISDFPSGIFTGPKALGYDPATGVISWEGDPQMMNTNHLLPIMGGFEFVNELEAALSDKNWHQTWLSFCENYRENAQKISKNNFRISRLSAYAFKHTGNQKYLDSALEQMLLNRMTEFKRLSTNDAATWSLDAIYLLSVMK